MKAQIDDFRSEVARAQDANTRLDDLAKQNAKLRTDLRKAAQERIEIVDNNPRAAAPAPSAKDAGLMKKLRDENSYLRNLLEKYATKNPELKPRLKKYQPEPAKPAETPATPPASASAP